MTQISDLPDEVLQVILQHATNVAEPLKQFNQLDNAHSFGGDNLYCIADWCALASVNTRCEIHQHA